MKIPESFTVRHVGTKAFTHLVGHGAMKKVPEFGTVESFPVWTKGFTLPVQPIALKKMPDHSKTLLAFSIRAS